MVNKRIYLDYAATTPVDPEVFRAMRQYFSEKFGNAGSTHALGREAYNAVFRARRTLAEFFGCESDEVIFTASATEANNLAIRGVVQGITNYQLSITKDRLPHIVTTAIEHDSVLEVCRALERSSEAEVTYVGVNKDGIVDPAEVKRALRPETVLVSVMYANNEIGTIQPIAEISEIIRNFRKSKFQNPNVKSNPNYSITELSNYPYFHTDAAQAVQFLDCDVKRLGVDLLTVSSHKIYGPKGAAALIVKKILLPPTLCSLHPIMFGGGQEYGMRPGTENVPAIAGFAKAVEFVAERRKADARRIKALRDMFLRGILAFDSRIRVNGSTEHRLPNNANVVFPGIHSEVMLVALDRAGIMASAGSACEAKALKPSHVLYAIGLEEELANCAIRFSLGRYTTEVEIRRAVKIIKNILHKFYV